MRDSFTELSDYWLSITRKEHPIRGYGKWMLLTGNPHRLYDILRDEMKNGALKEAFSVKTKVEPPKDRGAVYVHTALYTDQGKVTELAKELVEKDKIHDFQLTGPLLFKTDLHNTWCETLSRPGDGYHELLKRNWLYKYEDGKLVINAEIQALHQAMEEPPQNAGPEFLIIRSLLADELFAGANVNRNS